MDVELNCGDQHDAKGLAARVLAAAVRVHVAMREPPAGAPVETVVGDMGYCDAAELGTLQAAGIRTPIADPVRNRRLNKLPAAERRALRRALMRRRGELGERSFVHVLDYGGARRTPLRGRENIPKRYRIQAAGANLALLLRHVGGIGTLKQSWAASQRALLALLHVIQILLFRVLSHSDGPTVRRSHRLMAALRLPRSARDGPPCSGSSTVC